MVIRVFSNEKNHGLFGYYYFISVFILIFVSIIKGFICEILVTLHVKDRNKDLL